MTVSHSQEMLDRAALMALGTLRGAEAEEFERHLADGCDLCSEALESYRGVAGELGHAAEPVEPRAELRGSVMERIAAEAALDRDPKVQLGGLSFARTGALAWERTPIPGFEAKVLSRDPERQVITRLIRVAKGAEVPAHQHAGVEEIFVLEGDLMVSEVLMQAGDYCRADADSVHQVSRSPNGCVFLVVSSDRNKIVES